MAASNAHFTTLDRFCRTCGKVMTSRVVYKVQEYVTRLSNTFNNLFQTEDPSIHPESFCNTCYTFMLNIEKRGSTEKIPTYEWLPHINNNCPTCQHMCNTSKGGRPKKKAIKGRPPSQKCMLHFK